MSVGPFYFIYLRPKWKLFAKPADNDAEFFGHPKFWRGLCKDVIAPHYGIQDERMVKTLSELCYAMPRGRCSQPLSRRGKLMDSWTIYHGGDVTGGFQKNSAAIIRSFGLKRGQVRFVLDEHETMQADDQQRIQKIIGPVPYLRPKGEQP